MKFAFFLLPFFLIFISCNSAQKSKTKNTQDIIFQQKDKEILDELFEILSTDKNSSVPVLMIKVGTFFKETPYVASTLEVSPKEEKLVVNLREMDCTTFAENCLAVARTIKSGKATFEKFTSELQTIRYRDGKIDGYPSRLHYFSEWIYNNDKKKTVKSISGEIAQTNYPKTINFMSTHPAIYQQLKDNPELVKIIAGQEITMSKREMHFVPKEKIAELEESLMDGDIVGITTSINGLDISHVGILVRRNGRIHLMHASSAAEKVIVSNESLEDYLINSKSATGIMVARPLE